MFADDLCKMVIGSTGARCAVRWSHYVLGPAWTAPFQVNDGL